MKRIAVCVLVFCSAFCSQAHGQGGIITTVAGNGTAGFLGDGGSATSAELSAPIAVAVDGAGNLYIADQNNNRVRKVTPDGTISTAAGNGTAGYSGDGGAAASAELENNVDGVAVDAAGNLYIADGGNEAIRKVTPGGTITTVAGGNGRGFSGDGGPAVKAQFNNLDGIAVDAAGNLYIADGSNDRIREVTTAGIVMTVAGNGTTGFSGDGGPATSAELSIDQGLTGIAVDAAGNLYIADLHNSRVRRVNTSGIIITVVGTGTFGFSGDGGPAESAQLGYPESLALDAAGDLYIGDGGNLHVRKVIPGGTISTVAGNGNFGFSGDGGLATSASLGGAEGVAVDGAGNLYIADTGNNRIRKVSASASSTVPSITPNGIVPIYSTATTIQSGEWVSIYGTNLAAAPVLYNGSLPYPTTLGGTTVTVDNKSALLYYVSPTLIDLIAPADTATGTVPVAVTTSAGTANATVTLSQFGPSFFLLDSKHVAAIILRTNGSGAYGGGTYDILGPTGSSLGYATVAANPGDVLEIFANGLGPTNPPVPAGQGYSGAAPTISPVSVFINNVSVTPLFAGLSTEAGLYQINVTIPQGLGTGDVPLVATVGGVQTPSNVVISLGGAAATGSGLTFVGTAASINDTLPGSELLDDSAATGGVPETLTGTTSGNQTVYSGSGSGNGTAHCNDVVSGGMPGTGAIGNWTISESLTITVSPSVTSLATSGGSISGTFTAAGSVTLCSVTAGEPGNGTVTGTVSPGGAVTLTLNPTGGQ